MRNLLIASVVVTALTLAACGDDANKNPPAPKTSSTSEYAPANPPAATTPGAAVAADNSGRNKQDDGTTVTPVDQGTSQKDLAITQAVRQAVVAHKGLSVNGQNVKIIAKDGVVVLRGPVESESERATIVSMAEKVPEVNVVINKLEIASR
ncbi:MAG TPA: BON domain-containing protein [Planctomycetota bacterium]|jgi:osmotically-inducible protein OsmY|nr:BON domain-containing protein [Planctomycetota bacterium]